MRHSEQRRNTPIVNECWNILREVVTIKSFMKGNIAEIESALEGPFSWLEKVNVIDFEEDIVTVATCIMQMTRRVSPLTLSVVQFMPQIFEKYQGDLGNLFQYCNMVINHGKDYLKETPEAMMTFARLIEASLHRKSQFLDYDVSAAC